MTLINLKQDRMQFLDAIAKRLSQANTQSEAEELCYAVDGLTNEERRSVQKMVQSGALTPRNLWFNYETKEWI